MGPTWSPSGTDRAQVGPMLTHWTLLSGFASKFRWHSGVHSDTSVHSALHASYSDLSSQPLRAPVSHYTVKSSPPGQNGRHFVDDIVRCIFVNEKFCVLIKISLKFVPKGPIDNNPELGQIMAWRRIGDRTLSESMLTRWTDAYMRH